MKTTMKKILSLVMILAIISATFLPVSAAGETGIITVLNEVSSGISIEGDIFTAYQIFVPGTVTSYEVAPTFRAFFNSVLTEQYDGTAGANNEAYNQAASKYITEHEASDMYDLAKKIKAHIKANDVPGTQSTPGEKSVDRLTESATFTALPYGHYFIMNVDSELNGLGVASTGTFVDLKTAAITTQVKNAKPVVEKKIQQDKTGDWQDVDDSAIGDTVNFRVKSTLPANINAYFEGTYIYKLTDTMSAGITFNEDSVVVYKDFNATPENVIDSQYYTVSDPVDVDGRTTFTVEFQAKDILKAYPGIEAMYTFYSGTINENAVMAQDGRDENTVNLEYSNEPHGTSTETTDDDTVYHYSFTLDLNKLGEQLEEDGLAELAGAKFSLSYRDSKTNKDVLIKLTEDADGYYPNASETGEGYIVTDKNMVQIRGLDDHVIYTLTEVEAPAGYNKANPISFQYIAKYDDNLGINLVELQIVTEDGASKHPTIVTDNATDFTPETTIVNRLEVKLPATGGMGTTIFQIVGVVLMLAAAAVLLISQRKKAKN